MATKTLYILPHIHSLIHTPTAVSAMQGAIQLVGNIQDALLLKNISIKCFLRKY